jgi:hypothetical protein
MKGGNQHMGDSHGDAAKKLVDDAAKNPTIVRKAGQPPSNPSKAPK